MLNLMTAVASAPLSDSDAMSTISVRSMRTYGQYFRFLLAGGFATRRDDRLSGTERLTALLQSMTTSAFDDMQELIACVASFKEFSESTERRESRDQGRFEAPQSRFCSVLCARRSMLRRCVVSRNSGIFATPGIRRQDEFATHAMQAYESVREGEDFALAGAWLEYLVRQTGVHPVRARQRLAEAYQGGYVRRFFEGSTPETRYERRTLHVLQVDGGVPRMRRINLYHGDFHAAGTGGGQYQVVERRIVSLRERMRGAESRDWQAGAVQEVWGAGQPVPPPPGSRSDTRRREDEVDDRVADRVGQFETAGRPSQVVTVEGTQGVGKTNLLNYYEEQFRDYYQEDKAFYIIRYYPDPEPAFDTLLRKVFQNLDERHFAAMGRKLAASGVDVRNQAKEIARGYEVRIVLNSLGARWRK